ncbi:MAG: DUF1064 domain-containing protein [Gammaproteobacteria bacterium]|nr:DUF1064 domain-containing protein [Gammaproteobacteria bacterium]
MKWIDNTKRLLAVKINRKKGKRGPVRSKKVTHDGITFASGLEKYMYIALKKAKIKAAYEGETYQLLDSFHFENESFERQANGKGDMINRGSKKVLGIKYTPDFIAEDFIIETKGRANESFPIRWKLFKSYVKDKLPHVTLYKPQNQKECDKVVELILEKRKNND